MLLLLCSLIAVCPGADHTFPSELKIENLKLSYATGVKKYFTDMSMKKCFDII